MFANWQTTRSEIWIFQKILDTFQPWVIMRYMYTLGWTIYNQQFANVINKLVSVCSLSFLFFFSSYKLIYIQFFAVVLSVLVLFSFSVPRSIFLRDLSNFLSVRWFHFQSTFSTGNETKTISYFCFELIFEMKIKCRSFHSKDKYFLFVVE